MEKIEIVKNDKPDSRINQLFELIGDINKQIEYYIYRMDRIEKAIKLLDYNATGISKEDFKEVCELLKY